MPCFSFELKNPYSTSSAFVHHTVFLFHDAEDDENKRKSSNQRKRQRTALSKLEELAEQKKIKKEARKQKALEALIKSKETGSNKSLHSS